MECLPARLQISVRNQMEENNKTLGIICGMYGYYHEGEYYFHFSLGRIIDKLAGHYKKIFVCVPIRNSPPDITRDCHLRAKNVEFIPQPFYTTSMGGLKCFKSITKAYFDVCRKADSIFIRGMPPFVGLLYIIMRLCKCRVCHWIVGNPIALLKTHRRHGRIMDCLSIMYALQDRFFTRLGRRLVDGAFICCGDELGGIYKSNRTTATASGTIIKDEFHERLDTCQADKIRILFLSFIRPEKGVEYLIEAVAKLKTNRPWELVLAGPRDRYGSYQEKLEQAINRFGIQEQVKWAGYISYGPEMIELFSDADIFVLPTLSEGTPHVLVEARANSIPIISTTVGGIPTSVRDGHDGLLVPPKDSNALSEAIDKIIADGELRRSLIRNGFKSAQGMTLDNLIELIVKSLRD